MLESAAAAPMRLLFNAQAYGVQEMVAGGQRRNNPAPLRH
jgi:hypothetical protein